MDNILDKVYFRPINPHQYFPREIHGESEQASGCAGIQRLVHFYTDREGKLMLLVVFKKPDEFNPDRICGYQACLGDAIAFSDPGSVVRDLTAAGDRCEHYWSSIIPNIVFGKRRDPAEPRYPGLSAPARPSGHGG